MSVGITIKMILYILNLLFSIALFLTTIFYIIHHKCESNIVSAKEKVYYNVCIYYIIFTLLTIIPFQYVLVSNDLFLI